ncbi:MAG: hypothetical protein H6559_34925 [Lewinellaceae bacterium]|nr:hypothetical protein [Lewinellaceae bacterium]
MGVQSVGGYVDAAGAEARFYTPTELSIDEGGNIYVADAYNHRIRKIDASQSVTTLARQRRFHLPTPAASGTVPETPPGSTYPPPATPPPAATSSSATAPTTGCGKLRPTVTSPPSPAPEKPASGTVPTP